MQHLALKTTAAAMALVLGGAALAWNEASGEKAGALKLKPNLANGRDVYEVTPGQALIAQLKRELAKSKAKGQSATPTKTTESEKQRYVENLKASFENDLERQDTYAAWTGSGSQLLSWHYAKSLGRYFNNP
jgi:hypothetical protein